MFARAGESAARAAQRFAQRAGNDVDPAHDIAELVRAAPGFAEKAGGMRIVDHGDGAVFFRQPDDCFQIGDGSVHGETAIGRDHADARAARFFQLRFQVGHVVVLVAGALRFAETDAVDDRSVIQFVADDGVFRTEQGFEQTAVGIERARIKDRVFRAEEFRQRSFQLFMNVLRAANETHAGHAEPVCIERFLRGGDERGMIGQAEIVIRTEVQNLAPTADFDVRILRRGDDALGFIKAGGTNFLEGTRELLIEFGEHGATSAKRESDAKSGEKNILRDCL